MSSPGPKKLSESIYDAYTKNYNRLDHVINSMAQEHMLYKFVIGEDSPSESQNERKTTFKIKPTLWKADSSTKEFNLDIRGTDDNAKKANRKLFLALLQRIQKFYVELGKKTNDSEVVINEQRYVPSAYANEIDAALQAIAKWHRQVSPGGLQTTSTPRASGTPTSALLSRSRALARPSNARPQFYSKPAYAPETSIDQTSTTNSTRPSRANETDSFLISGVPFSRLVPFFRSSVSDGKTRPPPTKAGSLQNREGSARKPNRVHVPPKTKIRVRVPKVTKTSDAAESRKEPQQVNQSSQVGVSLKPRHTEVTLNSTPIPSVDNSSNRKSVHNNASTTTTDVNDTNVSDARRFEHR